MNGWLLALLLLPGLGAPLAAQQAGAPASVSPTGAVDKPAATGPAPQAPPQAARLQLPPTQAVPAPAATGRPTPAQANTSEVNPAEASPAKVTPAEVTPPPGAPGQFTVAQVTPAQVTPAEAAPALAAPTLAAPPQATPDQLTPAPRTPAQASPAPDAVAAPAPDVIVRQSLDPAAGAVIGQHVALRVDVLFRGQMPRPPRVSLPEVAGLQALRFETQATTMREAVDGETYVGQRFEFALYARRGGTFAIPPAAVVLLDRQGETAGTAAGQAVSLEVRVPPGADPSQPLVATRRMTLSEQWSPDPNGPFTAGDAVVRTIVRTAEDVPGLAMRDLAFPAPDGVRVYAEPPDISDQANRGVVTGRRMDRVTYVFERGGRFELPAAAQPWWDLGTAMLRTAQAPGAAIAVAAAPPAGATGSSGARGVAAWVAAGAVLLAVLALAVARLRRGRQAGVSEVEPEAFARLRRACAGGDAGAVYRAFAGWRPFLDPARDQAAAAALGPLDAALFTGRPATEGTAWDEARSAALLDSAVRLRRPPVPTSRKESLPPLNP